jgi:hypothetical protein
MALDLIQYIRVKLTLVMTYAQAQPLLEKPSLLLHSASFQLSELRSSPIVDRSLGPL